MIKKIVITGMSGCVGGILYRGLNDSWDVSGVDIKASEDSPVIVTDIREKSALHNSFSDAYAVIHCAANPSFKAPWEEIVGSNISGTQNVFEAAQESGVKKLIFASSNHVTGLYENDEPYRKIVTGDYDGLDPAVITCIDHTYPVRPDSYYGVSKIFGESLGRYYAEQYGMSVICIRIGSVNRENRPYDVRQYATLFLHDDLVSMVEKSLEDNDISFEIFYGVSSNTWRFWDTSHIRERLGWEPDNNAEEFR